MSDPYSDWLKEHAPEEYHRRYGNGRYLDPVRKAALHEAVTVWQNGSIETAGRQIELIVEAAKAFEDYLAGKDTR